MCQFISCHRNNLSLFQVAQLIETIWVMSSRNRKKSRQLQTFGGEENFLKKKIRVLWTMLSLNTESDKYSDRRISYGNIAEFGERFISWKLLRAGQTLGKKKLKKFVPEVCAKKKRKIIWHKKAPLKANLFLERAQTATFWGKEDKADTARHCTVPPTYSPYLTLFCAAKFGLGLGAQNKKNKKQKGKKTLHSQKQKYSAVPISYGNIAEFEERFIS